MTVAIDGEPLPLLLIHGDEHFLVHRDAAAWLAAARARSSSAMNVEVVESPAKLDPLRCSLALPPFLDEHRYVLVRQPPQLLEKARRGAEGADVLARALAEREPSVSVCLVASQRVAASNVVLKAVAAQGQVTVHDAIKGGQLRGWVTDRLRRRQLRLPPGAVELLVEASGGDLGCIENELDKITAYASHPPAGSGPMPLRVEQLRTLISGEATVAVWEVVDALVAGKGAAAGVAVDRLLDGGRPVPYLVTAVAAQVRELLLASELLRGGAAPGSLAASLGVPPWKAERLARQARSVNVAMLEALLQALHRVDAGVKQGTTLDADGFRGAVLHAAEAVVAG